MSCEKWAEPIALLVDGEPPADGLAEHLESCAVCSQLLQDLRADQTALRTVPDLDAPAIQRIGRRDRIRTGWWATAAIAAGLAIVFAWPDKRLAPQQPQPIAVAPNTPSRKSLNAENDRPGGLSHKAKEWDRPPGLSIRPRPIASEPRIDPPTKEDWARILFPPPEPEKRMAPRGSTSEVAMQIQTSNPDVVILWLKEERFQ